MARRHTGRMNGERYLANRNPRLRQVHDLDNEHTRCQVDEIIRAGNDQPYASLFAAHVDGYDNCAHCIGGATR